MKPYLAQNITINGVNIQGPVPQFKTLGDVISMIVAFVIPFSSVILFLILIWGGYDFLMSRGNADRISAGKAKITTGIVGFVLLVLSYFFAKLIGVIFGVGGGIL